MQDDKKLPTSTNPSVTEFLTLWNLHDPVYLDFQEVDARYEPDFCHVSAKHAAQVLGGRRVHGWALWQYDDPTGNSPPIIVGDFHSVWETADHQLRDVTPPKLGARVLFVVDKSLTIEATNSFQLLYHNRTNAREFPRLLGGNPVHADRFAVPNDKPDLVAYCQKLGLPDTSML